ncbi:tetratricopeptide repeat protein [Teratosphaeria destructans]|uniref:Tetratricopeptide repeat protein n=1 Tax=Teratosphaeria destructans TaxID=418781 RepID=A0A9W7ST70_9PEZI|nr:tetratricopeptide repeat protein [Teratosphaeria destructans]
MLAYNAWRSEHNQDSLDKVRQVREKFRLRQEAELRARALAAQRERERREQQEQEVERRLQQLHEKYEAKAREKALAAQREREREEQQEQEFERSLQRLRENALAAQRERERKEQQDQEFKRRLQQLREKYEAEDREKALIAQREKERKEQQDQEIKRKLQQLREKWGIKQPEPVEEDEEDLPLRDTFDHEAVSRQCKEELKAHRVWAKQRAAEMTREYLVAASQRARQGIEPKAEHAIESETIGQSTDEMEQVAVKDEGDEGLVVVEDEGDEGVVVVEDEDDGEREGSVAFLSRAVRKATEFATGIWNAGANVVDWRVLCSIRSMKARRPARPFGSAHPSAHDLLRRKVNVPIYHRPYLRFVNGQVVEGPNFTWLTSVEAGDPVASRRELVDEYALVTRTRGVRPEVWVDGVWWPGWRIAGVVAEVILRPGWHDAAGVVADAEMAWPAVKSRLTNRGETGLFKPIKGDRGVGVAALAK